MGCVSNRMNQIYKLPYRILRMKLTILELCFYTQILSEQVHHHSLHVATDATSVPMNQGRPTLFNKPRGQIYFLGFPLNCFPSEYRTGF